MNLETEWDITLTLYNNKCPHRNPRKKIVECNHPAMSARKVVACTRGICPIISSLDTCKDCNNLFFNQNPHEPLTENLISTCGVSENDIIHEATTEEPEHYIIPTWCSKKK